MESAAKARARFTVVQHDSARKAAPRGRLELAQSPEVGREHGRARLNLDACNLQRAMLDDDLDFGPVPVPEMEERIWLPEAARLPSQLLEHERLQHLPEDWSVCRDGRRLGTDQIAGESGVPDVNLRCLDKSADAVAVPRRDSLHQKQALEQDEIVTDRIAAQLER